MYLWQFLNKKLDALKKALNIQNESLYDSYMVSLIQYDESPPEVYQTYENTLGVTAEFYRDGVGIYSVIFDKELFISENDYAVIHNGAVALTNVWCQPVFFNALEIGVVETISGRRDDIIGRTGPTILEIRVYKTKI